LRGLETLSQLVLFNFDTQAYSIAQATSPWGATLVIVTASDSDDSKISLYIPKV